MPVNGLLLTLTEDKKLTEVTLSEIRERSDIELGERTDRWQPVVVDSVGTRGSHEAHEWLESLPGVMMVDVIFSSVNEPSDKEGSKRSLK